MKKRSKLVCGVGINDSDYQTHHYSREGGKQKVIWVCPFYRRWKGMLERCYSAKFHKRQPTYLGCSVCKEWLTFSNFKVWMETQDWEGKELDKDVLFPGNKVYSSETCAFVDREVNQFLTECDAARGKWLIGVSQQKGRNNFRAMCNDGSGRQRHLGIFNTEIEAYEAWLSFKQEMALKLAAKQTDPRVAKALIGRYESYTLRLSTSNENRCFSVNSEVKQAIGVKTLHCLS